MDKDIPDEECSEALNLNNVGKVTEKTLKQKRWKVFKTVIMSLSMLVLSLFFEIPGPTLPYLKDRIGANYEEVSRVMVARSVGYFPGTVMAGFMYDSFPGMSYFFIFTLLLGAAVAIGASPWCGSLELLALMFFLQGISHSNLNTGMNSLVIKMWGRRSGPALVSQAFLTGVGGLVASQVTNAFIKVRTLEPDHDTNLTSGAQHQDNFTQPSAKLDFVVTATYREDKSDTLIAGQDTDFNVTSVPVQYERQTMGINTTHTPSTVIEESIEYPYVITASICGFLALIYLGIFIIDHFAVMGKPSKEKNEDNKVKRRTCAGLKTLISPSTCTNGHPKFGAVFFLLFMILHLHMTGSIRLISLFLYSFARFSSHSFSPSRASNLNSAFWLSYTISRGLNTIAAIFCNPTLHFALMVALNLITSTILTIWGTSNSTMLWIFTCVYGFAMAPLFPMSIVWANLYVEMTAVGVSIAYLGSAFGGIIYQWFVGYMFDVYGPPTLLYTLLGSSINIVIVYFVLQVLAGRHGPKEKKKVVTEVVSASE